MPTNIIETATKGSTVSVPIGTDKRKASTLVPGFQALSDRAAWLEALVTRLCGAATDIITTALLIPVGNITLRLTGGHLIFDGDDDFNIYLGGIGGTPGGVQFFMNGFMAAHAFTAGRTGRANRKVVLHTAVGSIDPRTHDLALCTPAAGAFNLEIASETYVAGDHFRVVNYAATGGYNVAVKHPGGAALYTVPVATGSRASWADFVYTGSAWVEAGCSVAV